MIWSAVLTMTSLPSLMFRVASFGAWSNKTSGRTVFPGHGDTLLFPSIEEGGLASQGMQLTRSHLMRRPAVE